MRAAYQESDDEESETGAKVKGTSLCDSKAVLGAGACCCCCLLIFAVVWPLASMRTVPPAYVGVVTTFGSTAEGVLQPGTHVTSPFAAVTTFPTKTVLLQEPNSVPTREGLQVDLEVAVLYNIVPEQARHIFLTLGEDFEATYLKPQLASAVRGITGSVAAEALYNSTRDDIQEQLKQVMTSIMDPHGIHVENVLLKDIVLPQLLKNAIESKTAAQQEAERMVFTLQKEEQEAKRKEIEAKGIQKFQDIVSRGISPELLQWKGIEATQELAKSSNSKIVLMGNSKGSLPILMSNNEPPAPAVPAR
jgi:regulator of protease activity HflC (stomatin/prohibitin superfamily)